MKLPIDYCPFCNENLVKILPNSKFSKNKFNTYRCDKIKTSEEYYEYFISTINGNIHNVVISIDDNTIAEIDLSLKSIIIVSDNNSDMIIYDSFLDIENINIVDLINFVKETLLFK